MAYEVEWSTRSAADLRRLRAFLVSKSPLAASLAVNTIITATIELSQFPSIGRPLNEDEPEFRELLVPFSSSGYVVLYRFDGLNVEIQAIKHMSEAGY